MEKNKSFIKKIFTFFRPFRVWMSIIVGILIFTQLIGTLSPYLFGKGVDAVIHGNVRLTFTFLAIAFGISIFQSVGLWWMKERLELTHLDDYVERAFSINSMNKMFGFSIGQHINEHSGVKQSVVNKGQNALTNLMYTMLYNILPTGIQVIVTVIVLGIFDWRLAGIAIVFVTIYVWVSLKRNKKFFPIAENIRKKDQSQSKIQSELYRNAILVIAEGQETKTLEDYKTMSKDVVDFMTSSWKKYLTPFYLHKILIVVGQYTTLALGVWLILIGEHSAGMFVALFSWTSSIFGNLQMIMSNQRQMLFQVVEIKKLFDLLDMVPDINPNIGGKTIENLEGKIEFKDVSFAYPYRKSAKEEEEEKEVEEKNQEHTLEDINFVIPAGAKIGFVGVSGSGKSTIVNLMRRYYEAINGEILIDGVSIKDLDLRWLRSQIGNVEQKIELFDRSIRDNILFGLPMGAEVDEARLAKAVTDASLDEFVSKLKDHGLDTMIGEGGIKVSGGERQRIGIARALIKEPKILIFDEATSALDSINEKLIHEAINRSAEGRTTVIIAHRLSTVMDADIIFVVAEGKIVDSGTHAVLEKRSEEYQKLIKNQILMQ